MIKSLSKLFSGNVAVQAISFLLMPVITRIYSPEELGVYQFITTVALIVSPFVHLSLAQAMIREPDDNLNSNLLVIACLFSLFSSMVFSLVFHCSTLFIENGMNLDYQHTFLFWLLLLTSTLLVITKTQYLRARSYARYAFVGIVNSLTGNSTKILLGLSLPTSLSLVAGLVVGNILAVLFAVRGAGFKAVKRIPTPAVSKIIGTLRALKGFTLHLTLSQFISIFVGWHLVLFAPFIATSDEIGLLALAMMVTKTPSYPFLDSISNYAYTESVKAHSAGQSFSPVLIRLGIIGFSASFLMLIAFVFYGEWMFTFIFGETWGNASTFAVWLTIPLVAGFSLSPAYRAGANLFDAQKILVSIDTLVAMLLGCLCFVVMVYSFDIIFFIIASSCLFFLSHVGKVLGILCMLHKRSPSG